MTLDNTPITSTARATLIELAGRTGRPAVELLDEAVESLRRALSTAPVSSIPGVDPADAWEAFAQAEAGQLTPHADVFEMLRSRP